MLRATLASATNRSLAAASSRPPRPREGGHHRPAVHPLAEEDVLPRRVLPGKVVYAAGEPVAADAAGIAGPQWA